MVSITSMEMLLLLLVLLLLVLLLLLLVVVVVVHPDFSLHVGPRKKQFSPTNQVVHPSQPSQPSRRAMNFVNLRFLGLFFFR